MPALVWCGRRWRTAADDFTFSGVLYFVVLAGCGILGLLNYTSARSLAAAEDLGSFEICKGTPTAMGVLYFCLSVIDLLAAVIFLATAFLSLRGAIFEPSKRTLVPIFLYADALCLAVVLALTTACAKYAFYDGERHRCGVLASRLLVLSLALNFVVCCAFALSFAVAYDPTGRRVYNSSEEYERTWGERLSLCCCCCRSSKDGSSDEDAFRDVASVFSQAFRAYDMVPSDVAAGILLLHGYQYHSLRIMRERVRFAPPLRVANGVSAEGLPHRERVSSQAVPAKRLSSRQRELVRELRQYSRFYMAAYGYLLYEFRNCCTGLPRLCCFDPFMGCRHHRGRHYDTTCFCDVTALLKESAIPEEDLLLTSWSNYLCKPVHYACYDRSSGAVVVAIRGTMSFIDVVTDFTATPEVLELNGVEDCGFQPVDYYVHGGMLASARYVLRSLEYNGVMGLITSGKYKDAKVVVLGHSLGGGVALVLSVLMHSDVPELRGRLRCLAYAPPGGTLSEAVVEYCKDFTVGGFMGYDMIPRLAMHTFEAFREAIFDVTAASSTPKSLVYLNAMRTREVTRTIHPSTAPQRVFPRAVETLEPVSHEGSSDGYATEHTQMVGASVESAKYRADLRRGGCVPLTRPKLLYPCKTLIHFRKAVERSVSRWCAVDGKKRCCCGPPSFCVEDVYYPCFEEPKDVQMLVAAPSMFTDHMPERFFDVMAKSVERMDKEELERFYTDEEPAALPETVAPLHYISPTTAASSTSREARDSATWAPSASGSTTMNTYGATV